MELTWSNLNNVSKELGDAFYILDTKKFKNNFNTFLGEFRTIYPKTSIGYSYKTNYTPRLCNIVKELGGYAEVVSDMEYELALKVGVPYERIIVNGPFKSYENLKFFLSNGSIVNLDSYKEIENVIRIAKEDSEVQLNIGVRCNFEINDNTISRFGIDVDDNNFRKAFYSLKEHENVNLKGIHCHFPNRDLESYQYRADKIIALAKELFDTPPDYIDIGGGYFGKMNDSLKDQFSVSVPEYKEYAELIATKMISAYGEYEEENQPELILEPGSAIVGDVIRFVLKVIEIKKVRENYIAMTTGSRFNIGLISSKINMPMEVIAKDETKSEFYSSIDVSGYTCIESDYLYRNFNGKMNIDDYLVFENVGSYSVVFKPPFILPNVPIIEFEDCGTVKMVKRQEKMEDIFATFNF